MNDSSGGTLPMISEDSDDSGGNHESAVDIVHTLNHDKDSNVDDVHDEAVIKTDDVSSDDRGGNKDQSNHGNLNRIHNHYQQQQHTTTPSYDPFQLPPTQSHIPVIFRIPAFVFGTIYKKRVHDLILINSDRAKSAMLDEIASHILVNSLFLTVSYYPIFNRSLPLDQHDIFSAITVGLIYLLFNVQLLTIILYALIIFSMYEIPTPIFKHWLVQRQELVYFTARLDISGIFIFALCLYFWPLSQYDTFYQYICIFTNLVVWIIAMLVMGNTITSGPLDSLNPTIKIKSKPNNKMIRGIIQRDSLLFKPYLTQYELKSIHEVLIGLKLSHLIKIFDKQYISSMQSLIHLDHDDYRELGITIGERILIQQSEEYQYHKSNHRMNSYKGAFEKYKGGVATAAVDVMNTTIGGVEDDEEKVDDDINNRMIQDADYAHHDDGNIAHYDHGTDENIEKHQYVDNCDEKLQAEFTDYTMMMMTMMEIIMVIIIVIIMAMMMLMSPRMN